MKNATTVDGFNDWKHAADRFKGHEASNCHRRSVTKLFSLQTGQNVISCLSQTKQDDMFMVRQALYKMMTSILFLDRQGLVIRGKTDETSNLHQLLFLRASDTACLQTWIVRSWFRWLSNDIQSEILQLTANNVFRRLLADVYDAQYYYVMADETTDCSRLEQMVFCLRLCDQQFNINELFMGLYELA